MEQVLTIQRDLFDRLGSFQGVSLDVERFAPLLAPENHSYAPRGQVEEDETRKQLIPYILLHRNGSLLRYLRGTAGGERRLHGLGSVGFGGHVNDQDSSLAEAVERELHREELILGEMPRVRAIGFINDDSNPVGRVHLGIIYVANVEAESIRPGGPEVVNPTFVPIPELLRTAETLKPWSRLCLAHIADLLKS